METMRFRDLPVKARAYHLTDRIIAGNRGSKEPTVTMVLFKKVAHPTLEALDLGRYCTVVSVKLRHFPNWSESVVLEYSVEEYSLSDTRAGTVVPETSRYHLLHSSKRPSRWTRKKAEAHKGYRKQFDETVRRTLLRVGPYVLTPEAYAEAGVKIQVQLETLYVFNGVEVEHSDLNRLLMNPAEADYVLKQKQGKCFYSVRPLEEVPMYEYGVHSVW